MLIKNRFFMFMIATVATVVLSGCGGGDKKSGVTMTAPAQTPGEMPQTPGDGNVGSTPSVSVFDDLNPTQEVADNMVAAIGRAAEARPRAGSVTQSSNVDSGGVTTDRVEVTAEYGAVVPRFSVRNGTAWSIGMNEGNPSPISDTTPPWKGTELSKRINGGTVYVDAYTDIEAPTTSQVSSGDDGIVNVPLGTMILSAGVTINSGGNITGYAGMLDGEPGTFNCTGPCGVTGGSTTQGMWTFTPTRPPGAVDVSGNSGVAVTGSFNSSRWPGTYNGQAGYFKCLSDPCGSRTVNGRVMLGSGDWIFVSTSGTTTVTNVDTDYLAGGIWLFIPDNAASAADYVFGAFADGSDPFDQANLVTLQGSATYGGGATGVYSGKEADSTTIGFFEGDVELTANFGGVSDLGTLSGLITNFFVDGEPDDGTLTLGTANIGSQNSGFFKGPVSGSDGERSYTGHWGGQFFGNGESDGKPGSVAGTFGGSSTDDAVNFVGVFGATKQ